MREILGAQEMTDLLREVAEELDIDLSEAGPGTELDELGIDSLTEFELITALEDRTGLRIADEQVTGIKTISDLVDCLLDLQNARPAAPEAGAQEPGPQPAGPRTSRPGADG